MTLITRPRLYPYQEEGVDWLMGLGRGGILADDMGLGKTAEVIVASRRLCLRRVLIVTLTSVVPVWVQEFEKWAPGARVGTVVAKEVPQLRDILIESKEREYIVIGYDLMRSHIATLQKQKWDLVVFDEAHKLKNRKTVTHTCARRLMRKMTTERIWFTTGTPVQNHAQDYWPLLRAIADGFGSFWQYAAQYCEVLEVIHPRTRQVLGHEVRSISDPEDPRVKALVERVNPYVLRRTKDDHLGLPPKTRVTVPVDLPPMYRRMYKQMDDKYICTLPTGDVVTADTDLARTTRLLQLCVDWKLLIPQVPFTQYDGPKKQVLLDHVEMIDGRQFVVFSQWANVIDLVYHLLEDLKVYSSVFTGRNIATREIGLREWKAGETQALLVTIAAGGTGRDFTEASEALFLDRSWNPKVNEQAEDRLYRHGQTRPVTIYDFYCEDTVEDQRVFPTLQAKEDLVTSIVESLRAE
jgi:SNF2 family DNA or RNA helicase